MSESVFIKRVGYVEKEACRNAFLENKLDLGGSVCVELNAV